MRKIYTHIFPDLDAHLSCWICRRFVPGMSNAGIVYIGADWDGSGLESGDMAVDIYAGGRGFKGVHDPDGTVHSSSSYLAERYLNGKDLEAVRDLIRFVDIQDAHGSVVNRLIKNASPDARRLFAVNNIGSVLRAIEYANSDNPSRVFERISEIFDGYLEMGRAERRAREEADQAELFANGRVALVKGKKEKRTDHILWGRGVDAIVYVDGHNLGVLRRGDGVPLRDGSRFRADHPEIRRVVEKVDNKPWFAHPKGFLFCHGSRKAPARSPSNVNPKDLVTAVSRVLSCQTVSGGGG